MSLSHCFIFLLLRLTVQLIHCPTGLFLTASLPHCPSIPLQTNLFVHCPAATVIHWPLPQFSLPHCRIASQPQCFAVTLPQRSNCLRAPSCCRNALLPHFPLLSFFKIRCPTTLLNPFSVHSTALLPHYHTATVPLNHCPTSHLLIHHCLLSHHLTDSCLTTLYCPIISVSHSQSWALSAIIRWFDNDPYCPLNSQPHFPLCSFFTVCCPTTLLNPFSVHSTAPLSHSLTATVLSTHFPLCSVITVYCPTTLLIPVSLDSTAPLPRSHTAFTVPLTHWPTASLPSCFTNPAPLS